MSKQIETVHKAMSISAATALLNQYTTRDSNPEPTDYGFTQFKVVLVA